MPELQTMIGKEVEVTANGMTYRGTLVEVSDTDVHLKTAMQWVSLPVATVGQIRPVEARRTSASADTIEEPEEIRDRRIALDLEVNGS